MVADLLLVGGVVLLIAGGDAVLTGLVVLGVAVVMILFSILTVRVDATHVSVAFTLGFPSFRVALADIESVEAVRNKSWWGIGLRKIPGGWMYNAWGLDAIELTRRGAGAFRIGTDDPEGLAYAVNANRGE